MTTELAPIDADVLVCSFFPDAPHAIPPALALLTKHRRVTPGFSQFYAIITNPHRVSTPFTSSEAFTELASLRARPGVAQLPAPLDIVDRWSALIAHWLTMGRDLFDVRSVAAMLGNGVKKIYTFYVQCDEF